MGNQREGSIPRSASRICVLPLSFIIQEAAGRGHFHVVQYLCQQGELKPDSSLCSAMLHVIREGGLDCVKFLLAQCPYFSDLSAKDAIVEAATWGHLSILEYFHGLEMSGKFWLPQQTRQQPKRQRTGKPLWPRCDNAVVKAVIKGQLAVIKWLHANRWTECFPKRKSTGAMEFAASCGHFDVLKWLLTIKPMVCSTEAMDRAAANGHLDVVRWLHHNRTEGCTTNAMDDAAHYGHLEVVKWLHTNRTEGCTKNALFFAAANHKINVVKWLCKHRTEGSASSALDQAVDSCQVRMVRWLLCNTPAKCTTAMEKYPHLEIMQWLHSTGRGFFTQTTIEQAIIYGNLRTASWLHQNCPQLTKPNFRVNLWHKGCRFDMLLFLREHYPGVFTQEFIEMNVELGVDGYQSAHERNLASERIC